jgi:hypothetical protein
MTLVQDLFPHQLALVEEYRSGSAPHVVELDAPVGTGKTITLAVIAAERASVGGLVVVVLPHRALIAQMIHVLNQIGTYPITVYATPADFRLALDKGVPPWPNSGLVVCSTTVIRSPLTINTLTNVAPALLILDEVAASISSELGQSLRALANRTHQILFTGNRAATLLPTSDTRTWTFPLIDNEGHLVAPEFSVRVHEYPGDQTEAALTQKAIELLRNLPLVLNAPPATSNVYTRPAIQVALLSGVRQLENPEKLPLQEKGRDLEVAQTLAEASNQMTVEAIWRMLDDFDNLPEDTRLVAAVEEVKSAFEHGYPTLISTSIVQEVDYLAAAIESHGMPVSTVTGSTKLKDRASAAENLQAGTVLVATSAFFTDMQRPLPRGTRNLWFNPPRTRRQVQQRLGLGMSSHSVEIVLFKAVPPVTPADQLIQRLVAILQSPWQEPELEDPI